MIPGLAVFLDDRDTGNVGATALVKFPNTNGDLLRLRRPGVAGDGRAGRPDSIPGNLQGSANSLGFGQGDPGLTSLADKNISDRSSR